MASGVSFRVENPVVVARRADSLGSESNHRTMSAAERATRPSYVTKFDVEHTGSLDALEKTMMKYDTEGTGSFTMSEVKAIVRDLEAAKSDARRTRKLSFGLLAIVFAAIVVIFALVMAGNEASKESHVKGNQLVGNDGGNIQTENSDITTDGSELVTQDGVTVTVDTVESVSSTWDLPFVGWDVLRQINAIECKVLQDDGSEEVSIFHIASVRRDTTKNYEAKFETSAGHMIRIDANASVATITMVSGETLALDIGEQMVGDGERRRRLSDDPDTDTFEDAKSRRLLFKPSELKELHGRKLWLSGFFSWFSTSTPSEENESSGPPAWKAGKSCPWACKQGWWWQSEAYGKPACCTETRDSPYDNCEFEKCSCDAACLSCCDEQEQ